ncbi:bifunctional diaminohydroxyphosphoribosylaminopyrimidine deaminase/5-amino-6-(5-phosphoribosylamino)uracil reductase RibD [Motilimonas cestriensis]|uniref:Bifunctional diaminohydroxyphosphoribosylaminopyrimidine deaminase/5-amino-6-(5-phosphoribosylamino)uracil reductase RibD n=1 Tax=Motilimonas cestriensis TaxID=2742685 RepID=A0ABS8WFT7_9GAMM|nr:bifunctional diaminohydroxyphosphoribosylaminopyrimidine deaminase/5-amino-6-(5-phosphoribosylamino)uracil reductase RibD [Motilimonas cestriensis]MCE2596553.1 bifunctional diaminohydroxyphosphoribosylaminopyrimidine deaminase/5-amino-6-(5-phosphoribosylamino)uracil reductase RibD [Motilimonas cestriensis]
MKPEQIDFFMQQAIEQGKLALPACRPNPPVGCVAVKDGEIIAMGHTQPPGNMHAEAMVLAQLNDLQGVSLFVTLEPCSFVGRTPSCAKTMVERGVERVYVGLIDSHVKNQGRGIQILRDAGIPVEVGVLQAQLEQELGPYLLSGEG